MNTVVPATASDRSSRQLGTSAIPDHGPAVLRADESAGPGATGDEKESSWKSTASATAKLLLRGVRDTVDAFGPLKSVAGGLCFILENYKVWPSSDTPSIYNAYWCFSERRLTSKR